MSRRAHAVSAFAVAAALLIVAVPAAHGQAWPHDIYVGVRRDPSTYQDISLVALLANPAAFDGKAVRVEGFVTLEFEGSAIYLDREAYAAGLRRNAVWVDGPGSSAREARHSPAPRYAAVDGVFHADAHGHMGAFSGELSEVGVIQSLMTRADYYAEMRHEFSMGTWVQWVEAAIVTALAVLAVVGLMRRRTKS